MGIFIGLPIYPVRPVLFNHIEHKDKSLGPLKPPAQRALGRRPSRGKAPAHLRHKKRDCAGALSQASMSNSRIRHNGLSFSPLCPLWFIDQTNLLFMDLLMLVYFHHSCYPSFYPIYLVHPVKKLLKQDRHDE